MELGKQIKTYRMEQNLSQDELAERVFVTRQTISNWENENIQPSIEMLLRLSKLFNVTTDYLLGIDNVPRLNVDGLPECAVAHLSQLIDDLRAIQK